MLLFRSFSSSIIKTFFFFSQCDFLYYTIFIAKSRLEILTEIYFIFSHLLNLFLARRLHLSVHRFYTLFLSVHLGFSFSKYILYSVIFLHYIICVVFQHILFFPRNKKISMDFSFYYTFLFNNFLSYKKIILIFLYRKVWKFPIDDSCKPNKCTHIIEFNWIK